MARWVFPVPGLPIKTIFLLSLINWQVIQSLIVLLSIEG
jgi:hypothetical protein